MSDFDNLTIRSAYKDLKADKLEDGQKIPTANTFSIYKKGKNQRFFIEMT